MNNITETTLFRLQLANPDYPLAGKLETLTLKEWKRVYGYCSGCDILAMHGARLVAVPPIEDGPEINTEALDKQEREAAESLTASLEAEE